MAQIKISAIAAQLNTNAAAVATAAAGGVTTANITALANLLSILSTRNDYLIPLMAITNATAKTELKPEITTG